MAISPFFFFCSTCILVVLQLVVGLFVCFNFGLRRGFSDTRGRIARHVEGTAYLQQDMPRALVLHCCLKNYPELLWLIWAPIYITEISSQGFAGRSAPCLRSCNKVFAGVQSLIWPLILTVSFHPKPWADFELIYNHSSITIFPFPGASSSLSFFPRLYRAQEQMQPLAKQGNAAFNSPHRPVVFQCLCPNWEIILLYI